MIHVVNRQPVAGMADLRAALAAIKTGDPVVLHVERGGELVYVTFVADYRRAAAVSRRRADRR